MRPRTKSNITWAKCGIASLVGATHCPCFEPSGYSLVKGRIAWYLSMEGLPVRPLILQSIGGHDVLLDAAHDLLDSIVELSGQYNWEPNGSHT